MIAFLRIWEKLPFTDPRWLAYLLATTYHETSATMEPIEEYSKGAGYEYGKPHHDTGFAYYGRGWPQLTHHANYVHASNEINTRSLLPGRTVDLVNHPEQMLDYEVSGAVLIYGAVEGWFRKDKNGLPYTLLRYFNDSKEDWVSARNIINGRLDKAIEIAGYARAFNAALNKAAQDKPIIPVMKQPTTTADLIAQLKKKTGARTILLGY